MGDVLSRGVCPWVRPDAVHRDVYVDAGVYALEVERLWSRTWVYLGHDSQVPVPGDRYALAIVGRTVAMTRESGDRVSVQGAAAHAAHRGFVFVRLCGDGPPFDAWLGPMRAVIDTVADRSPTGRLQVVGAPIRSVFHANWKTYVENINDTVHPPSTHASVTDTASVVWSRQPRGLPVPMAMQQLLPFGSGHEFFERMGARTLPFGHSVLGTRSSIHASYEDPTGYESALRAAHGAARAAEVLGFVPQNAVLYPSLSLKAMPQAIRVIRPLAVDRTLIEAWAFQPEGAPETLARRAAMYNRLVFSPMSVLAHDDLQVFEGIQQALRADGNPWVSLHRGCRGPESADQPAEVGGTDERLLRNQFAAWAHALACP